MNSIGTLHLVRDIVASALNREADEIKADADIFEDLGGDDLDRVQIVLEIERVFGVRVDDEDMIELRTVAGLCALAEGKRLPPREAV